MTQRQNGGTRPKAVAFDIIETVFSLESLRPGLTPLGLPASALETWFAASLRDAFALAATGQFAPFRSVMADALADLLQRHGVPVMDNRIAAFLDGMKTLNAQPDAAEALAALRVADIPVIALSNGAAAATESLLDRAGLRTLFRQVLSVEDVGLSKPRGEVYLHAAAVLGLDPKDLCLVAAHAWDVHGAKSAGLKAAFVSRGQPYPATMLRPDIVGDELADTAERLVDL
jgi:2-haloacid dehalogenase